MIDLGAHPCSRWQEQRDAHSCCQEGVCHFWEGEKWRPRGIVHEGRRPSDSEGSASRMLGVPPLPSQQGFRGRAVPPCYRSSDRVSRFPRVCQRARTHSEVVFPKPRGFHYLPAFRWAALRCPFPRAFVSIAPIPLLNSVNTVACIGSWFTHCPRPAEHSMLLLSLDCHSIPCSRCCSLCRPFPVDEVRLKAVARGGLVSPGAGAWTCSPQDLFSSVFYSFLPH